MRKEVIYAVLAGISIGLIAAFGTWKVSRFVKVTPAPVVKKETPTPQPFFDISILNLKNFDVLTSNTVIKGKATPNTNIIVSTVEKDYLIESDSNGQFEVDIELPTGISEVKFSDTSTISTQKISLVYSAEVEEGSVSYVGTVTDISSGTIQIKNSSSGIVQASVAEGTKYINNLKKNIEIKESDLAIGDYIIAIGKLGTGKVLQSKQIIVTSPATTNSYQFEKITIEKLSKTKLNEITLPKTWNGPDIKELEEGQVIYIVGSESDDKTYSLRSIFATVE